MFIRECNLQENLGLNLMDVTSFILASLVHDYKHFGVNNMFLINSHSKLAIRYNDKSVLESYHVAETFKVC